MLPEVFGRVIQGIFGQAGYCPYAFLRKALADPGLHVGLPAAALAIDDGMQGFIQQAAQIKKKK